jgi:hypothetical protein
MLHFILGNFPIGSFSLISIFNAFDISLAFSDIFVEVKNIGLSLLFFK